MQRACEEKLGTFIGTFVGSFIVAEAQIKAMSLLANLSN